VPNDTTACSNRSQQFKPELRVRVPCPLDGSHSVYAFDLEKHVKVCNKLREATAAKSLPFYTENINSGTHVSVTAPVVVESTADEENEADGEQGETTEHVEPTPREEQGLIDRLALLDFPGLVNRVHAAYDKCVGDIPLQKRHHPCCDVLLAEKTAAGSSKNVLRHIEQQASILGNMDDVQLLDASAAFLELGAGRGMLSLALAQALPDNLYVLIDRAGGRGKADHIIRDAAKAQKEPRVKRAKIDIRHLNLAGMQELNDAPAVVGMSKHLCGVATDLSLRSLHTLPRGATDTDGKLSSRLKGLAVALCCHHVCRWEDYVSPEFFITLGFSAPEFALLCAMTSWATCAMGITGDSVEHVLGIRLVELFVLGVCGGSAEAYAVWSCLQPSRPCRAGPQVQADH
jgi:tRNA:m4X modification enzyme